MRELLGSRNTGSRVILLGIKLGDLDLLVAREAANIIGMEAEFHADRPAWQVVGEISKPAIVLLGSRSATLLEVHEQIAAAMLRAPYPLGFLILRDDTNGIDPADGAGDHLVFLSGALSYPRLLRALVLCLGRLTAPGAAGAQPDRFDSEPLHPLTVSNEVLAEGAVEPVRAVADLAARMRGRRIDCFPAELFGDPAWDILLSLAQAASEGRVTQASNIGVEASVPLSTSLRRIRDLEDHGLVRRWPDPKDKRREFVELSDVGLKAFQDYARIILEGGKAG